MGSCYGSYSDLEFHKAQKISKILTAQQSDGASSDDDSDMAARKRGEQKETRFPKISKSSKSISAPPGHGSTSESD